MNWRQIYKLIEKHGHSNLKAVIFDVVNGNGRIKIGHHEDGTFTIYC